jgi:hypothetical protein
MLASDWALRSTEEEASHFLWRKTAFAFSPTFGNATQSKRRVAIKGNPSVEAASWHTSPAASPIGCQHIDSRTPAH